MASSTLQYAAGDMLVYASFDEGSNRKWIGKRKRGTVYYHAPTRPLFVAEADFRAGKLITRVKRSMLVVCGAELLVLDVLALEAADSGTGSADIAAHVLRWVNYVDLLDVSLCGPGSVKFEHGDLSDKPKVKGLADSAAVAAAAAASSSSGEPDMTTTSVHPGISSSGGASSGSATTTAGSPAGSGASMRVTVDSFTLTFGDAAAAQEAVAAVLFQQAQYAAVYQWLNQGLHAGLKCDLVSLSALPLHYDDGPTRPRGIARQHSLLPPHVIYSAAGSSGSTTGPSSGASTISGAAPGAAPYPWGESRQLDWGCSVPLPAGWGAVLDTAAASSAAASNADEPDVTLEELSCPVVLDHGPQAIQVTFSTPLGAAVATVTPQLARAALVNSSCREVLGVPLVPNSSITSTSYNTAPMVAFSWCVNSRVATTAAVEGSSHSGGNLSSSGQADSDETYASSFAAAAGASSSTPQGIPLQHKLDVFAAVTVELVRTPKTAGIRGIGKVFDPEHSAAAGGGWLPGLMSASGTTVVAPAAPVEAGSAASDSSAGLQFSPAVQLQVAAYALLAGVAFRQLNSQPMLTLLQLLILAALAAMAIRAAARTSSRSSGEASSTAAAAPALLQQQQSLIAAVGSVDRGSIGSSESVSCCGWSMRLVSGDVCSTPSRHLQMQVSMSKASRGMARLRQRMASLSTGGALPHLMTAVSGLLPEEEEEEEEVPVLVSDPEPAWLTPDIKQRFLNAKPTLEASQDQAGRTHRWRQQLQVDTVLCRPCHKFELLCKLMPTYLLREQSPEGHAVVLMKVGAVNKLVDAIFNPSEASEPSITLPEVEHTLALLNEYLVQVAAPKPLPAGFQVQIYDLEGFKLSYVMGDMLNLFKILVRFGLYYPERLHQALVINAPGWFSYPWKAMSAFMDPNTSAKVVVVGSPKSALPSLAHHLGGVENVPAAWGGKCSTPLEQLPSHLRMMEFGNRLNAGQQPLEALRRGSIALWPVS